MGTCLTSFEGASPTGPSGLAVEDDRVAAAKPSPGPALIEFINESTVERMQLYPNG